MVSLEPEPEEQWIESAVKRHHARSDLGRRSVQNTHAAKCVEEMSTEAKRKKKRMSSAELRVSVERLHKSGSKSAEKNRQAASRGRSVEKSTAEKRFATVDVNLDKEVVKQKQKLEERLKISKQITNSILKDNRSMKKSASGMLVNQNSQVPKFERPRSVSRSLLGLDSMYATVNSN